MIPDLVVEVLSPATRANDLGVKREMYMTAGVKELWLADPTEQSMTRIAADAPGGETFSGGEFVSALLDGFAIDRSRLFAR